MENKEMYWKKYRGFEIVGERNEDVSRMNFDARKIEKVGGITFDVFDIEDKCRLTKLVSFNFAVGRELSDYSEKSFEKAAKEFVDNQYFNLLISREEKARERKICQLAKAVDWICENEEGEDLYRVLTNEIGLTDYDIVKIGRSDLIPYFNFHTYAEIIADWIVREGTEETSSGNWLISFEEIKDKFAVDLASDKEMLELIKDSLYSIYGDVICEMDIHEDEFDIIYFLNYCPNADD